MVLPMHVMFVGAFFILDPTLDWQIHEELWYDSLSLSLSLIFFLNLVVYLYLMRRSVL